MEKKEDKKEENVGGNHRKHLREKHENKSLIYILAFLGFIVVLFLAWIFISASANKFNYNGVTFENTQEGSLNFYKTTVQVVDKKTLQKRDFNFFLRTNPKDLEDVPFNGKIVSNNLVVLNSTSSFSCNGDGIIAIANLKQLYEVDGSKVIKDENATCDSEQRYLYINLVEGDETRVDQEGMCYTVTIKGCEIVKGTERLMLENFINWSGSK